MRRTAILMVLALVRAAHADDASDADALFQAGLDAKKAGHADEACAKFRASLDKNRNAVGTILNVALCDEEAGKIASAHKLFADAAKRAQEHNMPEHLQAALEHKDKLAGLVPRLTVKLDELAPDMKLVIDGDVVDPSNAKDIEVDPGTVKVVVSAPSRVPYETTVTIAKSEHKDLVIPKLGFPIENHGRATLGKVVTIAGGSVALVGIAVGLYASHKYNAEFDNGDCVMKNAAQPMCNPNGYAKTQSAHTLGWVGTGVGVAGVVAVGVGVTLWLTAPRHEQAQQIAIVPTVSPGQAGLIAVGRF